jgi:hypothetical protein
MPGYDGTGPRGMGPLTGGGRGFCSPLGRGLLRGFRSWPSRRSGRGGFASGYYGRGGGFGRGAYAYGGFPAPGYDDVARSDTPMAATEERDVLLRQLGAIEDHLAQIRERLEATDE